MGIRALGAPFRPKFRRHGRHLIVENISDTLELPPGTPRPGFVDPGPKWVDSCQVWPSLCRKWPIAAPVWPILGRVLSSQGDLGRVLSKLALLETLGQANLMSEILGNATEFGPNTNKVGPDATKLGPSSAKCCPKAAKFGPTSKRPTSARTRPNLLGRLKFKTTLERSLSNIVYVCLSVHMRRARSIFTAHVPAAVCGAKRHGMFLARSAYSARHSETLGPTLPSSGVGHPGEVCPPLPATGTSRLHEIVGKRPPHAGFTGDLVTRGKDDETTALSDTWKRRASERNLGNKRHRTGRHGRSWKKASSSMFAGDASRQL